MTDSQHTPWKLDEQTDDMARILSGVRVEVYRHFISLGTYTPPIIVAMSDAPDAVDAAAYVRTACNAHPYLEAVARAAEEALEPLSRNVSYDAMAAYTNLRAALAAVRGGEGEKQG